MQEKYSYLSEALNEIKQYSKTNPEEASKLLEKIERTISNQFDLKELSLEDDDELDQY
jgi:hypothetical protein